MQLSHQVMGLDTVPDAEFIKINKIKGRPLKDLITQKKKGSLEQLSSSYNHHNAH